MSIKAEKKALRAKMLEKAAGLDAAYAGEADRRIRRTLLSLPAYAAARTVFCFVGTELEIDTAPFLDRVLLDGKTLAVPLCLGKGEMEARRITSRAELEKGFYGIPEPGKDTQAVLPGDIDLAVIPCVCCSRRGERLGHGGGYYDRYFGQNSGISHTVMICREECLCEHIPGETHDLVFPEVVTERGLFVDGKLTSPHEAGTDVHLRPAGCEWQPADT